MSALPGQSVPMPAEAAEPRAGAKAVPVWIIVLLFLLLYGGMVYFDRFSGWFSPEVYAPYRSTEELAMYQPPSGGPDQCVWRDVRDSNPRPLA